MRSIIKRTTTIVMMAGVVFGLITCKKETIVPPIVKVFEGAITINYTKASVSAEVTDQGGAEVKSKGFVYGISGGNLDTVFCGGGIGVYSAELTNLLPNTTYVYEAFAKNAGGTGTSGKVTFSTRDYEMPTVKTKEVENVETTTASFGGNVTGDGGAEVTERGVCWSTNHNPSVSESHVSAGGGLGEFTCNMSNLSANTVYYVRAYAMNSKGIAYGEEKSFTTLDFDLPKVTTNNVTDITQTSAKGGGEVTSDGGAAVTERGICWSISHNPTINNYKVQAGEGIGSFLCDITGLNAHTTCYVRAYAINSKGTAYGDEVSFNTSANLPTVSTGSVTNITTTSAMGSGNVTNDGGSTVIECGICWSTHHEPTINGTHNAAGEGTGEFTASITDLAVNSTYYVRAYATNGVGTAYGDEVEFTTLSFSIPGVTTASVTNIGQTTATGGGNVISDGGATVTECGICWSTDHDPTISNSHATGIIQSGTSSFIVSMTNLTANTTYYVKAYAINSQGTAYGDEVDFTTTHTTSYTISLSANPANGGTVTGGGTYEQGQSCSVNAIATTGYNFQKWTENGSQVSTNANYIFNVTGNRNLVAQFQAGSYTISASANPSNGGTVSGAGSYNYGQSCILTATAATGYTFVKWTKDGTQVSTNVSYTFTVTGSASYIAHFQANNYTINVSANPSNGGSVSGGGSYTYGQSCTVHATASSGYTFTNWTENGNVVSTNANYTFTVNSNRTLVAHFTANPQNYSISVSASPSNGGSVSGGGTYQQGQSCTVHATASSGYTFTNWTENGNVVSTNANYTFTVNSNRTLVAHFTANPQNYSISVSASPSNGGSVSGGGTYQQGQSCTVHAAANTGYTFTNWTENGNVVSSNANYTFTVSNNRTLVAHFTANPQNYTINVSANPSNGGSVSGGGSYQQGQSCTIHAAANTGYTFTNWTENGNVVSTNANYTFTVNSNRTLVAHFTAQSYTISISASPSNGGNVSGGGTFTYGQSCTVHATANNNYTFTNWTENGSQVSTNANYTFTVTGNRSLVANFSYSPPAPTGAINGLFSVSATQQVWFSQGNLQYNAAQGSHQCADGTTQQGTWRFATNQWDCIGEDNSNISQTYNGWIDLFGWGTSGWNCGNTFYHPWDAAYYVNYYGPPGEYDLTGSYANSDWGHYNAISNGGNTSNTWRTLTINEWLYVFNTRSTTSGIRYAVAQVNNVNGIILVPDNWNASYYTLNNPNNSASFSSNVISSSTWTNSFQSHGAVFLPTSGYRSGTSVDGVDDVGEYWSASSSGYYGASEVRLNWLPIDGTASRYVGLSVRLVQNYN